MPALSRVSFFPRVLLLIAVAAAQGSAAITWDGDVDPADPTTWTLDTDGSIGRLAEGTLAVDAGSGLLSDFGYIGRYVGSSGQVTVDGTGSEWSLGGDLYVGRIGSGTLTVQDDGMVTADGETFVARYPGSSGTLHLDGGTLSTKGLLAGLDSLTGVGTINASGLVTDIDLLFDATHGSNQTLYLTDLPDRDITVNLTAGSGPLGAGFAGTGSLTVEGGAVVGSSRGFIGHKTGAVGTATVDGAGSMWSCGPMMVGRGGNGTLNIQNGGVVNSVMGVFGSRPLPPHDPNDTAPLDNGTFGGFGAVVVDGSDSSWNIASSFFMDRGSLAIQNGGTVTIQNSTTHVGWDEDTPVGTSAGTVLVDGAGSTWTQTHGGITIGRGGDGVFTVQNGGAVQLVNTDLIIGYPSNDSRGQMLVEGPGSTLQSDSFFVIQSGDFTIRGGATADVDSSGFSVSQRGELIVDGAGSVLSHTDTSTYPFPPRATIYGLFAVRNGGKFTSDSDMELNVSYVYSPGGTFLIEGAGSSWDNQGEVSIDNMTLAVRDGAVVTAFEDFTIFEEGVLSIGIGPGGAGWLDVTGAFILDDEPRLSVTLDDGITPEVGDLFKIVDFGTTAGSFSPDPILTLLEDEVLEWGIRYRGNSMWLRVDSTRPRVPGDFDGDDDVDVADLMIIQRSGDAEDLAWWRQHFPTGTGGDFDLDGDVDIADLMAIQRGGTAQDLAEWRDGFSGGGVSGVAAVPEPGAGVLVALAVIGLIYRRGLPAGH